MATGVSVAPPSRRSQRFAPQAPEEPIGESRQRCETEVSERDNNTESSAEASGDDADPKPAKSHVSRSQPPRCRDGKSSIIPDAGDDITTSHGWCSGSRTHRSYDEGIIIIIIIYYSIYNIFLLVDTKSTSRGRQRERSTPQGKKQARPPLQNLDKGNIILFVLDLILIYSRY